MFDDDPVSTSSEGEDKEPAGALDDEGFLRRAKDWFKTDREHSSEWRREAKEDYDFVAGHQWSEEDQRLLRQQMRPLITFNRIEPTVGAITGLEIGNRREVRFIPRTEGDAEKNEVLTAAADWFRDECNAEDEETDAFYDCVVSGMGWTESRLDYEEDPEGVFQVDRVDPFEMYWDSSARKRNLTDSRRMWRVKTMPIEEARSMFPDEEDGDLDAAWARGVSSGEATDEATDGDIHDYAVSGAGSADDKGKKEVSLAHLQWWERESYYRVAFMGQTTDVSEDEYPQIEERAKAISEQLMQQGQMIPPPKAHKQTRRKYMQAYLGKSVLEKGPAPCDTHFSWECITAKRDHNAGTFFGVVRAMKDPQRWANKWLSQSLHILNSNAKGGVMIEEGAVDDMREFEANYARADAVTTVGSGALTQGKIMPKTPAAFPDGFEKLMTFAISSIRDVSGVNLELLGLADRQQAGVLEDSRKQAGMTILAGIFDALRLYRKRQARIMLYYIENYLSDGRLIRIVGEEKEQYVPLLKQDGVVKYDVIVDDTATSPNQKERTWQTLQPLLPMLVEMAGPEGMLALAKYSPLPTSIITELKALKEKSDAEAAPKKQALEQIGLQQMQAEAQKTQVEAQKAGTEATENQAQVQLIMAQVRELQANVQKIMMEAQLLPMQAQADAQATLMQAEAGAEAQRMGGQARMVKAQQPPPRRVA